MAQYKVPQDVEADDKLIGPFSFRQFVYLLIAAGLIAIAVLLFRIFPLLAIIPVPIILLFAALALPLKKDQPMETYLAAIVSYYLKPRKRLWIPGQRESTIRITAPKIIEESRVRDITGEEATHRLSFLVDIVDSGGYAIKGAASNPMKEELIAEANSTKDMFENTHFDTLIDTISKDENVRHDEVVEEMREAINQNEMKAAANRKIELDRKKPEFVDEDIKSSVSVGMFTRPQPEEVEPVENLAKVKNEEEEKNKTIKAKPSIIELANNTDFSVATIAKEAERINGKDEGEVFISLH